MASWQFHIGIMGNLFSGKTTLMNALAGEPYGSALGTILGGAEVHSFTERVEKGSLTDECLKLFYENRVANIFPTETAFLHMRVLQQREIRHLMTRENRTGVLIFEDRPFLDGPEVFVKRMIDSGEMPPAHAQLYNTLFHQTLHNERIRLPDLTVYLIGTLEFVGGLLLILGLLTRPIALALAGNMIGALATAGRIEPNFNHVALPIMLVVCLVVLVRTGAGHFSVDRAAHGRLARTTRTD